MMTEQKPEGGWGAGEPSRDGGKRITAEERAGPKKGLAGSPTTFL